MNFLAKKPVQIAIFFYLSFLSLYFWKFKFNLSDDNAKWGTFGDFLGGALNPILGIITIVLTYDIIKSQITENKQSEFKYMFQILFDVIDENKNLIKFKRFGKTYYGREALVIINKSLENLYKSLNEDETSDKKKNFEKAFWSIYDDIDESSSTYMKTMHNCFKVIDEYCIDDRKSTYSDLVRAQLHSEELKFILYNGISTEHFKNLKYRLEKFTILKDIKDDPTIEQHLKDLYNTKAFEENKKISSIIKTYKILNYEISLKKSHIT